MIKEAFAIDMTAALAAVCIFEVQHEALRMAQQWLKQQSAPGVNHIWQQRKLRTWPFKTSFYYLYKMFDDI